MKTVQRSILRELLVAFLLGLVAFNFVLMTERILSLTKLLSSVGASFMDMLKIILYLQPQISVFTIPMALLVAALLTYGRLNSDSEITVLRASGMSFAAIASPVLIMGAGCFVAGVGLSFYLAPASAQGLRGAVATVISERAPFAIEEGIFNTSFRDIVVYVKEKPSRDSLSGVFIYDERKKKQPTVIYAKRATISGAEGLGISLRLMDGHIHMIRRDTSTDLSFSRYNLVLPSAIETPSIKFSEMPPFALLREAARTTGPDSKKMLLEFQRRLTLPALSLLLAFFGPPLALKAGKTGRLGGLTLGLLVFAVYYASDIYAEGLVVSGRLPLIAGSWGPAAALSAVALWMFRKENSR